LRKKNLLSYLLLPLSLLYGFVVAIRNFCFDIGILKEEQFEIPIISVGNITVGGTGKTPHIEYLIRLLQKDFKLAVLSRGYKRKTKGFYLANEFSSSDQIGDEPKQLKSKFPEVEIAVDADRRHGIKMLLASGKDIDIILLDDAFQHRYVKPGFSILLINYNRLITNDFLLPSGRLREPASSKKRSDCIIITKTPPTLNAHAKQIIINKLNLSKLQSIFFTKINQESTLPVFKENPIKTILELNLKSPKIVLLAGIANPLELKQFALNISENITEMYFPDHHSFTNNDILNIISVFKNLSGNEKILLTTEKDAMRFQNFSDLPVDLKNLMYYIPISVEFQFEEGGIFNQKIAEYAKKNK